MTSGLDLALLIVERQAGREIADRVASEIDLERRFEPAEARSGILSPRTRSEAKTLREGLGGEYTFIPHALLELKGSFLDWSLCAVRERLCAKYRSFLFRSSCRRFGSRSAIRPRADGGAPA